jgi:porin
MALTRFTVALMALLAPALATAYEFNDEWSAGGVIAAAAQCQQLSGDAAGSVCRGAVPLQPEFSFHPDGSNEFAAKLGFAAGNALGPVSPFSVPVWAADLEDDVRHVNGSGRSHLLTAWYRHSFDLGGGKSARLTAGIIDGADFLDDNAFANDEYTQFMNPALVNGPSGYVPSYDTGMALEWDGGPWSLRGVYMRVDGPEPGQAHDYVGLQGGYRLTTSLGQGEYRLVLQRTSEDFPAAGEEREVSLRAWIVSADQQLGEDLGIWVRFGRQDDAAAVRFRSLYSGGVSLHGRSWGRPADDVGIGVADARGGNLDTDRLRVVEFYYRAGLSDNVAATVDLQHLSERAADGDGTTSGWIGGLRVTLTF